MGRSRMGRRRAALPSATALAATLACVVPAAKAAAVPQCPAGTFQEEPIVFGCGASSGTVDFQSAPNGIETVFSIPPGTSQFQVKMNDPTGSADIADLLVYDTSVSRILVGPDEGVISNAKKEGSYDFLFVSYSGSVSKQESVKFVGTTEAMLQVKIKNKGDKALKIVFEYSYSEITECNTATPSGCAIYDALRVQRNVVDWSSWLQEEYESKGGVDSAWSSLQQDAQLDVVSSIPFYLWADIWALYPLANRESAHPMAIFKYVSTDGLSVTQSDFSAAYFAKDRLDATKTCVASLHSQYAYEHDAWQKIKDKAVQTGQAPIDVLLSECGGTPSQQADVRAFLDVDKSGALDFSEFRAAWNTLSTCPSGFYRSSTIIYHCQEYGGLAVVWMPGRETIDISPVPAGVINMHATIESDVDADLYLFDPVSHEYAMRWDDGTVNYSDNNGSHYGTWNGINIIVGGDNQLTSSSGGQSAEDDEFFTVNGTVPEELIFQVNNFATTDAWGYVRYGWDGVDPQHCPKVPVGCSQFCPQRALQCAMKFSDWLHGEYKNASSSWDSLASKYLKSFGPRANLTGEDAPARGVLFPQWQLVHMDWPDHSESLGEYGDCTWQEGFFFADDDNDGMVTELEWNRLYNFTEGIKRLDGLMCAARQSFPDAAGFMNKILPAGSVTIDRTTFINALDTYFSQGTLPGTTSHCEVVPEIPLYAWGRPNLFRVSEGDFATEGATANVPILSTAIGEAGALGFGTGSWTALARMYRVPHSAQTESIPSVNTGDNPVYIMEWQGSMSEDNLMLGLQDGHLTMDFSMSVNRETGTTCTTDEAVPDSEWTDVAYVYDASRKEQRIYYNGRIVKVCKNVEPFTASGRTVYVAEAHGGVSSFAGVLSTMYTYSCALAATTISNIFEAAPRWQTIEEVFFPNSADGNQQSVALGPVSLLGVDTGSMSFLAKVRREYQDDVALYTVMGSSGDPATGIEIAVDHGHFTFRLGAATCSSPQYVAVNVWMFAAFIYDAKRGELLIYQGITVGDLQLAMTCPNVAPWQPGGEDQELWAGAHSGVEGVNASASTGINPWKGTLSRMMLFDRPLCGSHIMKTFDEAEKWNEITKIALAGDGKAGGTPEACQAFTGAPGNPAPAPTQQPGGGNAAPTTQPQSPVCEVVHQNRRLQGPGSSTALGMQHHKGMQAMAAQAAVAAGMTAMGYVAKKIADTDAYLDNYTTTAAPPPPPPPPPVSTAPPPSTTAAPKWWKLHPQVVSTTAAPPTQYHYGGLATSAEPNSIAASLIDRNGDSSIDAQEVQAAMDEACHTIDPSVATEPVGGPPVDASGSDIVQKDEVSSHVALPVIAPRRVLGSPFGVGFSALAALGAAGLAFVALRKRQAQPGYSLHWQPAEEEEDLLEGGNGTHGNLEPAE